MAYDKPGEKTEKVEQVAWNLSQNDILLIGELWRKSTSEILSGFIAECYFTVNEVVILIYTDLKEPEDEKLEKMQKEIGGLIPKSNSNVTTQQQLGAKVQEYRKYVRVLLGNYGYLIAKKESSTAVFD